VPRRHVTLAEILKRALPEAARQRIYSIEMIEKRWAQAVGEELARRSEPEFLSAGVLTVRVTDAAWGRMILKLSGRIITALNRAVGMNLVRRINFQTRTEFRKERAPLRPKVVRSNEPPPASVARAAESITDPELRELVSRSAANYLRAQHQRRRH
jgi:hypothetical protein